jgi:hypothetical protein
MAVNRGTVRAHNGARLLATLVTSDDSLCPLPSDTVRPAIPDNDVLVGDPALVVRLPADTSIVLYRNYFDIRFDDSTSGPTIRMLLSAHGGEIVGGHPPSRQYVVRFPDPGPKYKDLEMLRREFMARPRVHWMIPLVSKSRIEFYAPTKGLTTDPPPCDPVHNHAHPDPILPVLYECRRGPSRVRFG